MKKRIARRSGVLLLVTMGIVVSMTKIDSKAGVSTERMVEPFRAGQRVLEVKVTSDARKQDVAIETELDQVITLVNEQRREAGLEPVEKSTELMQVAEMRAKELPMSFAHTRPDGRNCFTLVDEQGVRYWCVGENIAFGQSNAGWVMEDWMNSAEHRDNILYEEYGRIGVGVYENADGVRYWTQIFAD